MIWHLDNLIEHVNTNQAGIERGGVVRWVPARPLNDPWNWRIKHAWAVLMGRADAVVWPEGQ